MATGENEQGLRKVMDWTRGLSNGLLVLHCYQCAVETFHAPVIPGRIINGLWEVLRRNILFDAQVYAKLGAFVLLLCSLLGVKAKKDVDTNPWGPAVLLSLGIAFYWAIDARFLMQLGFSSTSYVLCVTVGYILVLTGGVRMHRIIRSRLDKDIFNHLNESFPQEERLIENEFSVNLKARYRSRKGSRNSWINIINPFRALLVIGTPGAGKSYFVIRHVITQHLAKGFSMFVYDFKYDDLSIIVYNHLLSNRGAFKVAPKFYVINFEDLSRSHRCNALEPSMMNDITDAAESARTIMLGLNRDWIKKQGDFFVESPINFVTAIIWFLKKYKGGI
ncbi:YWFCY domain-containing protein [Pseudochryseolinea flava]|uniref:YWFCY domain-containing protein n=1 Tax=Pseudochryseolinea flava TaxID=2059302 RepID=UPI001FE62477|nr:YWFCY domain-containing protein [Pseudochryseolinea flava]